MTRDRMQALRYPSDEVEAVTRLVDLHLRFHTYKMGWTDAAVRRYVRDAGDLLDELNELTRCDCTTRNERKAAHAGAPHGRPRGPHRGAAAAEELEAMRPDLDGSAVMAHLGVPPGPVVGRALAFLLEVRLEEGPLGARGRLPPPRRLVGHAAGGGLPA